MGRELMTVLPRRRCVFAAVLVSFATASSVHGRQQGKLDLSGTWDFDVQTSAGSGTPTVTLKQNGEKLTGHYSSQTLGEADLAGTVKGTDISFTFNADVQGTSVPVSYRGTAESNTAMKGSISITGVGDGTFTAKRR
jgi:hypothetical protein